MDLSRHLPTVLAVVAGLGIAYVALPSRDHGPAHAAGGPGSGSAASGYTPDPARRPRPAGRHRRPRPRTGSTRSSARASRPVRALQVGDGRGVDRKRVALRPQRRGASTAIGAPQGGKANCYETDRPGDAWPTAAARPFHVNTFAPDQHGHHAAARHRGPGRAVRPRVLRLCGPGPGLDRPAPPCRRPSRTSRRRFSAASGPRRPFPRQPLNTRFIALGLGAVLRRAHGPRADGGCCCGVADRLSEGARRA